MKILVPMAGEGSRFKQAGYKNPKPFIDIFDKPMIQYVIESLDIQGDYIFLVQKKHCEQFQIDDKLKQLIDCQVIIVDEPTEGAACTTLLARNFINVDEPLLIVNSDQCIEWDSKEFINSINDVDASILTFKSDQTKWSYVKLDESNYVIEVAEKKVISNLATVGIYYWNKGSDYVKFAEQMIEKNIRTNNEFYVCPVFNEAIQDGKKVGVFSVKRMWGLGTPEDLDFFIFFHPYKLEQKGQMNRM